MASSSSIPPSMDGRPPRKLRRAKTPKSKRGCVTCKARHVKCDETKPSCLRCLRFWGTCEGYDNPKPYSGPRAAQPIVPKTSKPLLPHPRDRSGRLESPDSPNSVVLYQQVSRKGFQSEHAHRYFGIFKTDMVESLPGMFKSELWERVILQACWDDEMDFVRDAAVAIGALSSCGRSLVEDPNRNHLIGTSSYRFALQIYGLAISKMRKSLSRDPTQLRKALLGCLLVICFEGLQGNYNLVLTHCLSGVQLLQHWLLDQKEKSYGSDEDTIEDEKRKMEGIVSPNRYIIEDELVQAFGRLDLQVMAYIDPRPTSTHESLMKEGEVTVRFMPDVFLTVDTARLYWEVVQRRSSHFIASAAAKKREGGRYVPTTKVDLGGGEEIMNFHPESEIYGADSEMGLPRDYQKCAAEISRWFDAFFPFYNELDKDMDDRTYIASSLLLIHAKTSEIMLLSSLFGDESSLDRFLPEYKEVVALASEVTRSKFFKPSKYKFDLGIVNPLRMVAKWCREPRTRREAIGLLRESGVREGIYDGLIMARTQEYIMELEEEGMDENGQIPEDMRWRYRGVKLDCVRRIAEVEAERLGRGPDGERVVRGTNISW